MHKLEIAPDAYAEMQESADWYQHNTPTSALEFLGHLHTIIDEILDAPQRWPRWDRDLPFQVRTLKQLPYRIVYVVRGDLVRIEAVAHTKRPSGYWLKR